MIIERTKEVKVSFECGNIHVTEVNPYYIITINGADVRVDEETYNKMKEATMKEIEPSRPKIGKPKGCEKSLN